jgi:hypothetical protein
MSVHIYPLALVGGVLASIVKGVEVDPRLRLAGCSIDRTLPDGPAGHDQTKADVFEVLPIHLAEWKNLRKRHRARRTGRDLFRTLEKCRWRIIQKRLGHR